MTNATETLAAARRCLRAGDPQQAERLCQLGPSSALIRRLTKGHPIDGALC